MKSKALVASMFIGALMAPSVALTQSQPSNRPPPGPVGRSTQAQESWRFESEAMRRRNAPTAEEAEADYGAERMDLARRVAALVEEGKCNEARAMANAAGERQMALRIRRTCREGSGGSGQAGS